MQSPEFQLPPQERVGKVEHKPLPETEQKTVSNEERAERRQELLEALHHRASMGLAFEQYLSREEHPSVAVFLRDHPGSLPQEMVTAYGDMCVKMQEQRKDAGEFMEILQEHGADDMGKFFFETKAAGYVQQGPIRVEQREGYVIVSCASEEDYLVLSGVESAGTYHRSISMNVLRKDYVRPSWDGLSGMPPPLAPPEARQHAKASVLLVQENALIKKETIVAHERQHFMNEQLFGEGLRNTEGEQDPAVMYRDELIAMVRAGASLDGMDAWMSGENYARLFAGEVVAHAALVNRALKEAAPVFRSDDARALLAHHLLMTPLKKVPSRIRQLSKFYTRRLEQAARGIAQVGVITADMRPYPRHLVPQNPEARALAEAVREAFTQIPDVATLSFADSTSVPDAAVAEYARAFARYIAIRDEFIEKTGLPERIDAAKAAAPPPLPPPSFN